MPVLYGVFLFMGVAALKGMQVYIYNKCNTVYLMHFQHTFPQHFFTTFCVEFFFYIFRENDYSKCCLISVCWPPRSHLHAQEVPARSHVPSSRADQACSPLHLIPNRLSCYTVGGEDDQVHLHSLPRHGNIFTRYIWLWNIQLGMNQYPLVLAYEMFVSIFIIYQNAFKMLESVLYFKTSEKVCVSLLLIYVHVFVYESCIYLFSIFHRFWVLVLYESCLTISSSKES